MRRGVVGLRERKKNRFFRNAQKRSGKRRRASEKDMEAIEIEGGDIGGPAKPVVTDVEKGGRPSASAAWGNCHPLDLADNSETPLLRIFVFF